MKLIALFFLMVLGIGVIKEGFLPLLFLVGVGVWAIVKSDKAGAAIESFFALSFFLGLIGFVLKILIAVFS